MDNYQQLIKKLQELPEVHMLQCLEWYCSQKGTKLDIEVPEIKLSFKLEDSELVQKLDKMVTDKIQEIKDQKIKNKVIKKVKKNQK